MQILKPLSGKQKSIFRKVKTACSRFSLALSVIQWKKGQQELHPGETSRQSRMEKKKPAQLQCFCYNSGAEVRVKTASISDEVLCLCWK